MRKCPDATVIRPNMTKYAEVGRQVRQRMFDLTPLVEPLSIDEAFLDLTGTERLHGMSAAKVLARFASDVERDLGITVSVGLSGNKFLAKIASDLDKPRGFAVLSPDEAAAFLAPRPVGFIYGVGAVTAAKLTRDGYRTIADLQRADEVTLMRRYGEEGQRLWRLARGIDARKVDATRETKSISAETTFERDIGDLRPLEQTLVGAHRKGLGAAEGGVACRLDRHAQAQERRLQDPHPRAFPQARPPSSPPASTPQATISWRARWARHASASSASASASWWRQAARTISPTCSTAAPRKPSTRSTPCAPSSARAR